MTAPAIFDPGLQPERTQLAWRRTALSVAVGSIVAMRILPAVLGHVMWVVPGIIGVVCAAWMWAVSARRYRDFNAQLDDTSTPLAPGAGVLLALAAFVVAVGALALTTVILGPSGLGG